MLNLMQAMELMPLIAILRGITPEEVVDVVSELVSAGFSCVEVPTNSPRAFESIVKIEREFKDACLIGAGTVVAREHVDALTKTGATLMIAPNTNPELIRHAKSYGLECVPGCMTPSEVFTAYEAGADAVKLFPCNVITPDVLHAMKAIFPKTLPLIAVGDIQLSNLLAFKEAGAAAFGLGSSLYRPGDSAAVVGERAQAFVKLFR